MSKLPSISVPIQIAIAGVTLAIIMALMVFLRDPLPPELVPTREETTLQDTSLGTQRESSSRTTTQSGRVQETATASNSTAQVNADDPAAPRERPADFGFVGTDAIKEEEPVETASPNTAGRDTAPAVSPATEREPTASDTAAALSEPVTAEETAGETAEETAAAEAPVAEPLVAQEPAERLNTPDVADTPVTTLATASEAVGPVNETDTAALEDITEPRVQDNLAEPAEASAPDLAVNSSQPAAAPEVQATTAQPDPTTKAPRFDLVRVDNSGATVIAGQAAPGAEVQVTLGNAPLETVRADQSGSFVAIVQLPAGNNPQTMGLEELRDGDVVSASPQTVLVVPPQPDTPETAPTIVVADTQGAAVIQPGQPPLPEELSDDPLSLDTISYDQGGAVVLAGRGSGAQFVRVYVDNQPVQTEPVLQDGNWRVVLPAVDQGVHTLRVDQISKAGDVLSRVESPFKREAPAELAAAARNAPDKSTVVVQPGHTLWALAESRYGDGVKYVQIFRANRDRIRDADLIYPGQVFDLPEAAAPN
ncbi:LysM peptidoglycan-binding domain-containing protein [Neptunicoccus sediminis]|uniref:LysM peptidoglycan-binding domain-containing protein n=1 Tax=Neptunicoccus sediminis TaxID=1892596 RepID=UPI000845C522|nr:LysM peptidoglycan-binding domain-containing protein [Neptunicoccus sediminis]